MVNGIGLPDWKIICQLASSALNTRQYLQSQDLGAESGVRIDVVHFANVENLSEDAESSKNRERHIDVDEAAVMDSTGDLARDRTTASQREGKV